MKTASERLLEKWEEAKRKGNMAVLEAVGDELAVAYKAQVACSLRLEENIHRLVKEAGK